MKRLVGYFLCFVGLCAFFTTCYYISFRRALSHFNEKAVERDHQLLQSLEEYKKQELLLYNQKQVQVTPEPDVSTTSNEQDIILPSTKYILETYQLKDNSLVREELAPTADLIGLTRREIILKLSDYMKEIPISEEMDGLYGYELLTFSPKEFVIRKSYNADMHKFQYYVAVRDGKVIVYYSDRKTVYEQTEIDAVNLPENDRNELMKGIEVRTRDELYSLLESYSS
ncbi:BofC C-terminal domain-containing protein [Lachnoclostridium phytofermentans]|uniref:Bypass of forespore C C-terminal domain-containing protein n=1 Tax=Lachnoclostridium phytofermentans (strain ATCC 700394 / DSM 18823 / ISDg) TaxID=357809 RepID=A9KMV6_LACP7|nr:BofC C-terminal domain-containing protein [Lachnoclostridium phytofermentans]ABX42967.1 hypothetical protein Cphy_2606 [Lachnoclostridium phytofermentans ISDg]